MITMLARKVIIKKTQDRHFLELMLGSGESYADFTMTVQKGVWQKWKNITVDINGYITYSMFEG